MGRGPAGEATILDQVGTTLHLLRETPDQIRDLQQVGTHHTLILQHPDWSNKSVLQNNIHTAATATGHPEPDPKIRDAYNSFWITHKQPLPQSPRTENGPTIDRRNWLGTFRKSRYWQSSYWRPTASKSPCGPAKRRATSGCYPRPRHASSTHHHCHRTHPGAHPPGGGCVGPRHWPRHGRSSNSCDDTTTHPRPTQPLNNISGCTRTWSRPQWMS